MGGRLQPNERGAAATIGERDATFPFSVLGKERVFGELMGNYYYQKLGLDVRGVRLPGVISWRVEPTAGTTDYAVGAFYGAVREKRYTCYLKPGTYLPMMYMPDAVLALIRVAEADIANQGRAETASGLRNQHKRSLEPAGGGEPKRLGTGHNP